MNEKIKKFLKDIIWKLRNLYWSVYGAAVKNPNMPSRPNCLLFVCKGNICRSPFAERLAEKIADVCGNGGRINIKSAGLTVSRPLTPPQNAVMSAASFGVHLDNHKSKKIDQEMINAADMILVMEAWHLKTLKKKFPYVQNKIFLLSLFDKEHTVTNDAYYRYHIADPYGKPLDQFQMCYRRIEKCTSELFKRISA